MAIVTIRGQRGSGGGGGAGLNYSVVGGTVQPASPKENMIWINTAVSLGDIQLNCASAPTTRSDGTALQAGDVYIAVLTTTTVPFNALKKNGLLCLPGTCYQYDGSAWNPKDAYIYQSGSWAELPSLPPVGTSLAAFTWEQINSIGAAGKQADYFAIGDEKPITLSTSEVITLQIIGFNHDNLSGGTSGKAPITFGFKSCMATKQSMNATDTNVGGYSGCALYTTINNAIYNSLPDDLRAVMKNVSKLTSAGNQSASIVTTQEKLFMLSEVEIFGSITHAKSGEGTQYAFFTNGGARVKTVAGVASAWWERSPYGSNTTSFCDVNSLGAVYYDYASTSRGVALGLCV